MTANGVCLNCGSDESFGCDCNEAAGETNYQRPCEEWRKMAEPIVKKCRLSATFNRHTRFNAEGSKALAALLEKMATELDQRS